LLGFNWLAEHSLLPLIERTGLISLPSTIILDNFSIGIGAGAWLHALVFFKQVGCLSLELSTVVWKEAHH
jgi:hypothetical protein